MLSGIGVTALLSVIVAFGFGVVIGSFLNVVSFRLNTGRTLQGRSHCLTCGTYLRWFELLPVVSYLALRGRCRSCRAHVSSRYFWVELVTGVLFAGVTMVATSLPALAIWWLVISVLVVVVVYDYYHLIIPDRVVVWLGVLAVVWLMWQFFAGASLSALVLDIGAAAFGAAIYGGLWFVSKGQWLGLGDAKLAWPLGVLLGAEHVFSLVVFSFWIGAIISLLLIAVQWLRRRGQPHLRFLQQPLTIKSEVPFAPFLVMSFLAIYFFGLDALAFTEQLVSLS